MRYDTEYQHMKSFILILLITLFSVSRAEDVPRLVSTAPSITESIVYLGKKGTIVGVSNFCQYEEMMPRVGSAITPNYEKIVSLNPNKVLVLKTANSSMEKSLKKLNLPYVSLSFNSLDEILGSVLILGKETGAIKESKKFVSDVKSELIPIKDVIEKTYVWVISSETDNGMINKVMVAGSGTHYHNIIKLLGFYTPKGILPNYHSLSLEQLIKMKPDYIFVSTPGNLSDEALAKFRSSWEKMKILEAVKNKKVFIFSGDEFVIPGTSILKMIKKVKGAISAP